MTLVDNAVYVGGRRTANPASLDETYALLREREGMAWIGLYRPDVEELRSVAQEFDLHHLSVDDAIAAHQRRCYGIELDPDTQVQVTFGATEALASALLALVSRGDEVAMLDPSYDSYAAVVALAGGVSRPIRLSPPDWRVTADAVAEAVSDRTRVLLVNSPHNPTGTVLSASDLTAIAEIAVVRRGDVRRAKLYYLRGRSGKSARIAERARSTAPVAAPAETAAAE